MSTEAPDILSPASNEDPYPILEDLREHDPLYCHEAAISYMLSRYEDVRATVTCLLAGANRDPRKYDDPARFDIFREDLDMERAFTAAANHTSFALGRHFCVGAILALTEGATGTNRLLDPMDEIGFANGPPNPVGVFTRSPVHMPLNFRPAA